MGSSLKTKKVKMFNEPLDIFTDISGFGEIVVIDGVEIRAIFDRESAPDNAFGLVVGNADPQLIVKDTDVPSDTANAVIVARGVAYSVASVSFDGTGMSVIQLKVQKHDSRPY